MSMGNRKVFIFLLPAVKSLLRDSVFHFRSGNGIAWGFSFGKGANNLVNAKSLLFHGYFSPHRNPNILVVQKKRVKPKV